MAFTKVVPEIELENTEDVDVPGDIYDSKHIDPRYPSLHQLS